MSRHKYLYLANLVFAFHLAWVFAILWGTYYIFGHRGYIPWHLLIVSLTLTHNMTASVCVFTAWEQRLRRKYNPSFTLHNSFIRSYAEKIASIRLSNSFVTRLTFAVNSFSILIALVLLF